MRIYGLLKRIGLGFVMYARVSVALSEFKGHKFSDDHKIKPRRP